MTPRRSLLLAIVVFLVAGCGESGDSVGVDPGSSIEQEFLFDVYFINAASGYMLAGTYIDRSGNVVTYDHSFERWVIEGPESVSGVELREKFSAPTDTIGTVDAETLRQMYEKMEAAAQGDLSDLEYSGNDAGAHIYCGYQYDKLNDRYVKVLLSQTGDFTQTNLSAEAQELIVWLRRVLAGQNQAVQ